LFIGLNDSFIAVSLIGIIACSTSYFGRNTILHSACAFGHTFLGKRRGVGGFNLPEMT